MLAAGITHWLQGFPAFAAIMGLLGATAPDWLELPFLRGEDLHGRPLRLSVIPHRTLTHWVPLWLLLLAGGLWQAAQLPGSLAVGFAVGGLTHLLMDVPNPMGVPLWVPWRRKSLRWWRSGEHEIFLVAGSWAIGAFVLTLTTGRLF